VVECTKSQRSEFDFPTDFVMCLSKLTMKAFVFYQQNQNCNNSEEVTRRKIDQMVAQAKEKMAKGDKKGALYAMKRKKLHDAELAKIENVKMTLETQVINLESASQNKDTFMAMKEGKNAMSKIRDEVGIDKVDELMDDIREEMEQAQEISDAIAAPVDPLAADEDELLAELEQMGADDLEAELLSAPGVSLPSVPNKKLPAHKQKEEEEMKALEAELAGM